MTLPASIAELQQGLRRKDFSCREIVAGFLDRIEASDKQLGAFLRTRRDVLDEAQSNDERLARGQALRPLEGVAVAIKDNLLLRGAPATAGSQILANYQAVYTATAVQRLIDAGALIVGQTNLDEFAMGASTENSALGTTRNPWNQALVPGGSSGGSAVAVAAGQAMVALGSDTGGSIRQPAAFCNVVGLKPTYGRVSRYGLIALASSLDQIGPLTRTVADAAQVYQLIAGPDACDLTANPAAPADVITDLRAGIQGLRIGLPPEFFGQGVDPQIVTAIQEVAKVFTRLGATIDEEITIPHAPQALPTYYIIQPAEASSNLARYDGVRYGLSVRTGPDLAALYHSTRAQGFGPEVKRRMMIGTFSLSAGYADAYYHQANRVRDVLREEFHRAFDRVDLLLTPTTPTPAFPQGAKTADPLTMYLADLLTVPANLAGIPAVSLPAGFVNGLPVGAQLMANAWDEATLFRAAYAFEQATDWHRRQPPLSGD